MQVLLLVSERSIKAQKQMEDLVRVYGKDTKVVLSMLSTYAEWKDIVEAGRDCNVLAGDFPIKVLVDLIDPEKNNKPVVLTKMEESGDGFKYVGLEQVKMAFERL